MSYTICIRVEENHCWIEWRPEYSDTFSWGLPIAFNHSLSGNSYEMCKSDDFITISDGLNADKAPENDRICGQRFSTHNYIICEKCFLYILKH